MKSILVVCSVVLALFVWKNESIIEGREVSLTWQNRLLSDYNSYDFDKGGYFRKCNALMGKTGAVDDTCIKPNDNNKETIFLWGDSHAAALGVGLREKYSDTFNFLQITSSGCRVLEESARADTERERLCVYSNQIALDTLGKEKINTVIIAQEKKHSLINFKRIIRVLEKNGVKNLVVVGPVPQWRPSLPLALTKQAHLSQKLSSDSFDYSIYQDNFFTESIVKKLAKSSRLRIDYINLIENLCSVREGVISCNPWSNFSSGELLIFDYGHLTNSGAIYITSNYFEGI
ncbi:TPA: SGNH hydrolase domain-containing protein [Vibrio diabolicus]